MQLAIDQKDIDKFLIVPHSAILMLVRDEGLFE